MNVWEDAWNAAQPRLAALRNSLDTLHPSRARVLRVGQLDSELLDQELVSVLQEPLSKALSLIDASFKSKLEPELMLVIQMTLYKLSIWNTGASYGAKLQDLHYVTSGSKRGPLSPSGIPRRILAIHGTLTIILPYLHKKFRTYALSRAWPDAPRSNAKRKAWEAISSLEACYTCVSLVSFVAFLWNGRYRSIADRLLGMRLSPTKSLIRREVSYEFMNRQMVWHAFTEFLIFALPLINTRSIQRRISRGISHVSSTLFPQASSQSSGKAVQKKGRYWALPQDQCAICAENASLNLDISQSANAFSSFATPSSSSVEHTTEESDTSENEPSAFPIYNPYIASCGDIYCYHCIAERMMQASDADEGYWECLRCTFEVTGAERYMVEVEMQSDITSDYEFSSDMDMSTSIDSYSESTWSDENSS